MPESIRIITDYDEACAHVAQTHGAGDSNVEEIYLFPDESHQEIRLVEVDPSTLAHGDEMTVFRFGRGSMIGVPYRLALAVIRPNEHQSSISPPEEWGTWNRAKLIWSKSGK